MQDDLYEIWITCARIQNQAWRRGYFTREELTRLEDLGEVLSRIAEEEMRRGALLGP